MKQKTNKHRHYRARTKLKAIAMKGGRCQRCGFADERALQFHHNKALRRGSSGLSKKAQTSTESHRAVVRGDGKGLSLLCSNCIAIMKAQEWTANVNTTRATKRATRIGNRGNFIPPTMERSPDSHPPMHRKR